MSAHVQISKTRVGGMALLLLAVLAGVCAVVRLLPATPLGYAAALVLGLAALPVAASPIEWVVHRYVYHRAVIPFLRRIHHIHHRGHHTAIFPTWRYVTGGPIRRHPILADTVTDLHRAGWRNGLIKLSHFAFYLALASTLIFTPAWLATRDVAFAIGLVISGVVVSDLFVRVHDAIHYPGLRPWIEKQGWFHFLETHHFIHHVDLEANVNFLLPLADLLFGTMRRTMTKEETARHGTLAEAKAHPVGTSEPAAEVARPRAHA